MNYLHFILGIVFLMTTSPLVDFNRSSDLSNWFIVDDVVMGGRSAGNFYINEEGDGVFEGYVSLENYGGFSSVRYRFESLRVAGFKSVLIRLKGDNKRYQFRVKESKYDRYSYVLNFQTGSEWEIIEIPLKSLSPTFRGMSLDMPNFPSEEMEEIAILIANEKAEDFKLIIDKIWLE